ncbi:MAG: ABC transporter substrate-binding protein [Clostridia bacterium]
MKKILCLMLCLLAITASFYGCSNDETDETITETETTEEETTAEDVVVKDVVIGYYADESLNPYLTTSSANQKIASLLYDSLVTLDSSYDPYCELASAFNIDENKIIINLKDGLVFSDGTTLDAHDIAYSFELAKESYFYSSRLSNFQSITTGTDEIIFTLYETDVYAVSCLNFPIVKSGTGEADVPTGSGSYKAELDGSTYYLVQNTKSTTSEELLTTTINLLDISKSDESNLYLLQIGDLSFYYDDLSSPASQNITANTAEISTNNLVYLGMNNSNIIFENDNIAEAFYWAIDINQIVSSCFDSYAEAAVTIFNPDWYGASDYSNVTFSQNTQKANELLENSGYVYGSQSYRSNSTDALSFTLIVNSESEAKIETAELIQEQLAQIGVEVIISELSFDEYTQALEDGEYDLYVGEIKLSSNMDLSVFFDEDGAANYGISVSESLSTAYSDFISGNIDISTFLSVLDEQRPIIALCYKTSLAYYSRELQYTYLSDSIDIFANVYSWTY